MLVRADKKWDYAIGMIKVDGLEPTEDMKKLIEKEKKGEISIKKKHHRIVYEEEADNMQCSFFCPVREEIGLLTLDRTAILF